MGRGIRYGTTPGNEKLVQSPFQRTTSVLVDSQPGFGLNLMGTLLVWTDERLKA